MNALLRASDTQAQLATHAKAECYMWAMATPFDDELRDFIEFEKRDRERKVERDDRIVAAIQRVADQQSLTDRKLDMFAVEVREQMKGVHARLSSLEDEAENTGNHNLEQIRTQNRELKEEKSVVLKYIIGAIGSVSLMLLAGAGTVIWYLIVKGH
jgi:hypothetical protein